MSKMLLALAVLLAGCFAPSLPAVDDMPVFTPVPPAATAHPLPTVTSTPTPQPVVLPTCTPTPDVVMTVQAESALYGDIVVLTPAWEMMTEHD